MGIKCALKQWLYVLTVKTLVEVSFYIAHSIGIVKPTRK